MKQVLINISRNFIPFLFYTTLVSFFLLQLISLFTPGDIRGVESNVIYTILQILSDNKLLYQDPEILPFNVTQYPPLYYILNDGIYSILGIDINPYSLRLISRIFSNLILAIVIFHLIQLLRKDLNINKEISCLAGIMAIIFTFPWYSISRPDVLLLFLLILMFRLCLKYFNNQNIKYCFGIGVCLSLSLLTKQHAVIILIIIIFYFGLIKEWRSLFVIIITATITFISLSLIINALGYNLQYWDLNILNGLNNGIDIQRAVKISYFKFLIYFTSYILLLISAIHSKFTEIISEKRNNFILFSSLILFLYSLLASLKVGSAINYFNEFLIISCMLTGLVFNYLNGIEYKLLKNGLMIISIHVIIIHFTIYTEKIIIPIKMMFNSPDSKNIGINKFMIEEVENNLFFSNDKNINLNYWKNCILFSNDVHELTYKTKAYNYKNAQQNFIEGKIKFLVINGDLDPVLGLNLNEYYSYRYSVDNYNIYQFK